MAAGAHRPAGHQGGRRHLRGLDARAGDRGARARRRRCRRGDPGRDRAARRRRSVQAEARFARGDAPEGGADRSRAPGRNIWKSASAPTPRSSPRRQPMAAVGTGADAGLHPRSSWNNPEPEVVLAVSSRGAHRRRDARQRRQPARLRGPLGAAAGKAKDNNASCAIGPFLRLFDAHLLARRRAHGRRVGSRSRARTASGWKARAPWPRSAATPPTSSPR